MWSVPPVTKYLPPELKVEHNVWSPILFFSMNLIGEELGKTGGGGGGGGGEEREISNVHINNIKGGTVKSNFC